MYSDGKQMGNGTIKRLEADKQKRKRFFISQDDDSGDGDEDNDSDDEKNRLKTLVKGANDIQLNHGKEVEEKLTSG